MYTRACSARSLILAWRVLLQDFTRGQSRPCAVSAAAKNALSDGKYPRKGFRV